MTEATKDAIMEWIKIIFRSYLKDCHSIRSLGFRHELRSGRSGGNLVAVAEFKFYNIGPSSFKVWTLNDKEDCGDLSVLDVPIFAEDLENKIRFMIEYALSRQTYLETAMVKPKFKSGRSPEATSTSTTTFTSTSTPSTWKSSFWRPDPPVLKVEVNDASDDEPTDKAKG